MKHRKSGPLRGLRVVSLPWQAAAKVMGMILADNGASVVELERVGEEAEPRWELAEAVWKRGKTRVAIEDAAQVERLACEADVFITDWGAGELAALGADAASLTARFPSLVYLQVSGYGAGSAREGEDWSETLVMAAMGFPWMQQGARDGPRMPTFPAGSYATAFNGMTGILAALHARAASGRGQVVETSIADGLTSQQPMGWYWSELNRTDDKPIDIAAGGMGRLVLAAYPCKDDEWVHIHTGAKGAFSRLMKRAGIDDRIPPLPITGQSEIGQPIEPEQLRLMHETLPKMFRTRDRDEWLAILRADGVSAMPDLLPGECLADPQALENQLSTLVDLPDGQTVRAAGAALKFSETAPRPGQVERKPGPTDEAVAELNRALREPAKAAGPSPRYPLAGLKVVDFGVFFAGPYASRLLADLGADVIRLENLAGCPMRPISQGRYFNGANHHKRPIAVDLKRPEAREIIARLAAWADVVQHNMRPGVAESLGMGYEDLRAINPALIYAHSPAFGALGPYRGLPGFEPLSSALTGLLMRHEGCRETGPYAAIGSMDPGNGLLGAAGILMALRHRDLTGEGQYVECPQMGSAILSTPETVMREDGSILDPCVVDREQYGFGWWKRLYEAADGWLVVDARTAAARDALLSLVAASEEGAAEAIAAWAAARPREEVLAALRSADVPAGAVAAPYSSDAFFFDEENLRLNRVIEYQGHPKWGRYRDLGPYWRFSDLDVRTGEDGFYVPPVGAHTRPVLGELGFAEAQIDDWKQAGVIG